MINLYKTTFIFVFFMLLVGCTTTKTVYETVELEDPRVQALEKVAVNLSDLPPDLDLGEYDIEFKVVDIENVKYIVMTQEDYNSIILVLTETAEHIRVLRTTIEEQNRLVRNALAREEMDTPDKPNADGLQVDAE